MSSNSFLFRKISARQPANPESLLQRCNFCDTEKLRKEFRKDGSNNGIQRICRTCENRRQIERKRQNRYQRAKQKAEERGKRFALEENEYKKLVSNPCHYCKLTFDEYSIGLDRLDHARGYEIENVIPCCGSCNRARGTKFTVEEMCKFIGPAIRAAYEERKKLVL